MIGYRPTPGPGARQWDYPCLHNPFAITGYFMDLKAPSEDLAIGTLEDLPEFKNVISLDLMFPHQADLTPVSTMTKLEVLQFYTEDGLDTLDWMEPLKNLRYLRISRAYPEITDVRVLGKLEKLDTILINLPNLTDLSVFAALPNLEEMELVCSEEADTDSLRKAEQIKRLYINGEEVRWEYPE